MNDIQYPPFFNAFEAAATPRLQILCSLLAQKTGLAFTDVVTVDHDVERGIGFYGAQNPEHYVELMLTDGDERGFEGVGLMLECSNRPAGIVWAPHNYSDLVGTLAPAEVTRRLGLLTDEVLANLADQVITEWEAQKPTDEMVHSSNQ